MSHPVRTKPEPFLAPAAEWPDEVAGAPACEADGLGDGVEEVCATEPESFAAPVEAPALVSSVTVPFVAAVKP